MITHMRTQATEVKLRRLVRAFGEAQSRLASEPLERGLAGSLIDRLQDLAGELRESWRRESLAGPVEPALDRYVKESLRWVDLAIAGLRQAGADLQLLRGGFQGPGLPLGGFLAGLEARPALQASR